jgi:hypothetical protein
MKTQELGTSPGKTKPVGRPVVVCTEYRGVFFGYAKDTTSEDTTSERITLTNARMCIYWSAALHGVLGLASEGPDSNCKIGNAVEQIELRGVTAVLEVSVPAADRWEKAPWSS